MQAHSGRVSAMFGSGTATFLIVGELAPRLHINPDDLRTPSLPDAGAALLALAAGIFVAALLGIAFVLYDRRSYPPAESDRHTLIADVYRPFIWLVILPMLVGLATLGVRVMNLRGPLPVDNAVDQRVIYRFQSFRPALQAVVQLGSPVGVGLLSLVLAVACLIWRRRKGALLIAVGPATAGVLTEYVLKPLISREKGVGLAFPSGHTTGSIAVAAVLAILLLPYGELASISRRQRWTLALLGLILVSGVPLALIVLQYHYVTDIVAGFAVASAVVFLIALGIDAWPFRIRNDATARDAPSRNSSAGAR